MIFTQKNGLKFNKMIDEKLIFDIGMHNGRDTDFYLRKGFKVIAVEASPITYKKGLSQFEKEIEKGQLKIINKAISNGNETLKFRHYKDHDDWSSTVDDWNDSMYSSDFDVFEVLPTNVDELMQEFGTPYYMKIDIEGSDALCLDALLKVKEKPKYISVELLTVNNLKENSKKDYLEILSKLRANGYTKFQLVDQSKHAETKCPKPALEGTFVEVEFDGFSSGLFGKELPNNWKSIDEVVFDYLQYTGLKTQINIENQLKGKKGKIGNLFYKPQVSYLNQMNPEGWFDVHATY